LKLEVKSLRSIQVEQVQTVIRLKSGRSEIIVVMLPKLGSHTIDQSPIQLCGEL